MSTLPMPARWASLAICVAAVAKGSSWLAWLSVPVLFWTALVVWGRCVVWMDNLKGLPRLLPGPASQAGHDPRVTVISPARNEEAGIEAAVRSLAAQEYPELEVLVVDDHSTDSTTEILERLAARYPQVRRVVPPDLPAGWAGKPNASWSGYLASDPASEWLLFTDARVVFHPSAVRQAVAHAERERLDFLTCIFRFEGTTLAEGLVAASQARLIVSIARRFGGGDPEVPIGLGAFSMVRRSLYEKSGGHSVFRAHPMEDYMLARLAKHYGGKLGVATAAGLISLHRYYGLADMRRRVPRAMRISACDQPGSLLDRAGMEAQLYFAPLLLSAGGLWRVSQGSGWVFGLFALLAGLAYLAGVQSVRVCAAVCRFRRAVPWLHPFGALLSIWFLGVALAGSLRRAKLQWRDRSLAVPRAQ